MGLVMWGLAVDIIDCVSAGVSDGGAFWAVFQVLLFGSA